MISYFLFFDNNTDKKQKDYKKQIKKLVINKKTLPTLLREFLITHKLLTIKIVFFHLNFAINPTTKKLSSLITMQR
ncbi:MAG: hypothetical protein EAZ44_09410 [Cytophagia bacterium]|nr:MAG: hypothetical protein EAY69_00170 [Cytophagales bacterium]TAG00444.1 MAG: hypothetical protein EAZ44_09410 [Cytophagia bacterium]TAG37810.1 MAG: hypothetical protein EAZ31_11150 [Cytophagia bacterium]TAH30607.1 MAG: hypothetical protein EAZ06_02810 [Cytophagales bacterium]